MNKLSEAENQYHRLIENHDQMNRAAHWELANLYTNRDNVNAAVASLLKYYDLVLPESKEAGKTELRLKDMTTLQWSQNIYSSGKDHLLVDNNKIFSC